jgi:hypothetical protein
MTCGASPSPLASVLAISCTWSRWASIRPIRSRCRRSDPAAGRSASGRTGTPTASFTWRASLTPCTSFTASRRSPARPPKPIDLAKQRYRQVADRFRTRETARSVHGPVIRPEGLARPAERRILRTHAYAGCGRRDVAGELRVRAGGLLEVARRGAAAYACIGHAYALP